MEGRKERTMNSNTIRRRNLLLILVLIVTAILSLAGCSRKKTADNTIHIGVMYSSDIIPLAVITENGLDKKHGIQLDMQVFSSARDRDAALQAGELDGVFTDYIGMCMYRNAGLDMKITGVTDGDYLLIAGQDTGITSIDDAVGSSIAISENTLIEYTLDYLLDSNELDSNYLKKEVVPKIPDRLEMLRTGKIAMGLLPEPFATLAVNSGAVLLGSANQEGLYPAVSAFSQTAIDSKKEAVRSLYAAYDEAVDYINNTPLSEYEATVIKAAGYPEELSGQIELPVFRKNTLPSKEDLADAIQWAAGKGLCSTDLKPEDLLGNLD